MLRIAPTKSGYLATVGIEDFRLKESNVLITGARNERPVD